jgi:hypothetical protein
MAALQSTWLVSRQKSCPRAWTPVKYAKFFAERERYVA